MAVADKCGAKKRQTAGNCTFRAGWGTSHVGVGRCRLHGGNTGNHRKAAIVAQAEAGARELFGVAGIEVKPVENPLSAYADFAGRVMAWMRTLDKLLDRVNDPRYDGFAGEQIRGEVVLFERAMDRANTVLSTYAKLNIDERLSRISADQEFMVLQAIETALSAAGVTGAKAIEAKKAAARRLRVEAGQTEPTTP